MTDSDSHRIRGVVVLLLPAAALWASPAGAQSTELQHCLQIEDIAERVACYDAIARAQQDGRQSAPAAAPVTAVQTQTVITPAPSSARGEFGLSAARREKARAPEAQPPDEIETGVVSIESAGANYWRFVTTDGAIWRTAEARRSFRPPRTGDKIRIRAGRLGSYYLEAERQPSMRVIRIK